jgi:hypothetical protein
MRHRSTGKFYVGSTIDLRKRIRLWKLRFEELKVPRAIAALSTDLDDWEFVPLEKIPGNTLPRNKAYIQKREREYIDRCRERAPELVLNATRFTTRAGGPTQREYVGATMSRQTYYRRRREGLTHEEALTTENRWHRLKSKTPIIDQRGQRISYDQAAAVLGCTAKSLMRRIRDMRNRRGLALKVVHLANLLASTRHYRRC